MESNMELDQKELEELLEEELEEKKNAENFLLGAIEKNKAEARTVSASEKKSTSLLDSKPQTIHEKLQKFTDSFKASRDALDQTFKLQGSPEAVSEVNRTLVELDLNKHSFSAIALASVASNNHEGELAFKKIADKTHKGLVPGNDMAATCKKACDTTKEAIAAYKSGNPGPLGKILGAGVRNACNHFATMLDRQEAVKWSDYIEDILPALEKDPELQKASGLSKEEMHAANGAVQIGCIFKRGFKAIDEMSEAALKGTKISETRMVELTAMMTQMEFAAYKRETEVADWLKKSDASRGQYLNSMVQQQYGAHGVPVKQARMGVIPGSQLEAIREISNSKSMELLMNEKPEISMKTMLNATSRKTFMLNVHQELSQDRLKKNVKSADKKVEKVNEKKQEQPQKGALKKEEPTIKNSVVNIP